MGLAEEYGRGPAVPVQHYHVIRNPFLVCRSMAGKNKKPATFSQATRLSHEDPWLSVPASRTSFALAGAYWLSVTLTYEV
jgi:hypothetical protein